MPLTTNNKSDIHSNIRINARISHMDRADRCGHKTGKLWIRAVCLLCKWWYWLRWMIAFWIWRIIPCVLYFWGAGAGLGRGVRDILFLSLRPSMALRDSFGGFKLPSSSWEQVSHFGCCSACFIWFLQILSPSHFNYNAMISAVQKWPISDTSRFAVSEIIQSESCWLVTIHST